MGPLLAQHFAVIAPDNRGMGNSLLPPDRLYTSEAMAEDLYGLLKFLNINQILILSHDKGCGPAAALAILHPELVKGIIFSEYGLPGFGYEQAWNPTHGWDLFQNWQLAFFSVPEAAEFFIRGREKEMLSWYFFHASYSGNEAINDEILTRYANSISKPGFLRSMLEPFAAYTVRADNEFFTRTLGEKKIAAPTLVLGGEASLAPTALLEMFWGGVSSSLTAEIVPKAGHWIGQSTVLAFKRSVLANSMV